MSILNMDNLKNCFEGAEQSNKSFVAVRVRTAGFPSHEIIINPISNARQKLEYYQKAYDDDLSHKFAKGVSITGFTYGNSMSEIEDDLNYE